jgi:hypothetical protein
MVVSSFFLLALLFSPRHGVLTQQGTFLGKTLRRLGVGKA